METLIENESNVAGENIHRANKRRHVYSAIAMLLVCLCIGSIIIIVPTNMLPWFAMVGIQLLLFLVAGLLHVRLTYTYNRVLPFYSLQALRPTALLAFGIAAELAVFFAFTKPGFLFMSVSGGAAFLLPAVSLFAMSFFEQLVEPQFSPWYLRKNLLDNKAFVFLSSVPIRIQLAPQANRKKHTIIKSVVPAQMEFGKIFHYFVAQQQHRGLQIETEDAGGDPVGWHFYVCHAGGRFQIPINPEANMWTNQVRPHSLVVAKRVTAANNGQQQTLSTSKQTYALYQY